MYLPEFGLTIKTSFSLTNKNLFRGVKYTGAQLFTVWSGFGLCMEKCHHDQNMPTRPAEAICIKFKTEHIKGNPPKWFYNHQHHLSPFLLLYKSITETKESRGQVPRYWSGLCTWKICQCQLSQLHPGQASSHWFCLEGLLCTAHDQSILVCLHPHQVWNKVEWSPFRPDCCDEFSQSSSLSQLSLPCTEIYFISNQVIELEREIME